MPALNSSGRRTFLTSAIGLLAGGTAVARLDARQSRNSRIVGMELLPVRATSRTVWLFVRLRTSDGVTGLGEASDAFGFANTTAQDARTMEAELRGFFAFIENQSPLNIEAYRQRGMPAARRGLVAATAFSAIEQALWDLSGKLLGVPVYTLFGGKVRDRLPVYANVNRATNPRTPAGFAAAAKKAVGEGFRAVKAAPFDGFPAAGSSSQVIEAAISAGIDALVAMREAVGPGVALMVDCHSFFDVEMAVRVAERLEPVGLTWYEEPVAPEQTEQTTAIRRRIRQPMAGGELLFGATGFSALTRARAVDVVMPDVKHCGGLLELSHIAALADIESIKVAPHNPSGPVSTAASIQVCAFLPNFNFLELQWGEVEWRSSVVKPPELFRNGTIQVPNTPGLGIQLDDAVIRQRLM